MFHFYENGMRMMWCGGNKVYRVYKGNMGGVRENGMRNKGNKVYRGYKGNIGGMRDMEKLL